MLKILFKYTKKRIDKTLSFDSFKYSQDYHSKNSCMNGIGGTKKFMPCRASTKSNKWS